VDLDSDGLGGKTPADLDVDSDADLESVTTLQCVNMEEDHRKTIENLLHVTKAHDLWMCSLGSLSFRLQTLCCLKRRDCVIFWMEIPQWLYFAVFHPCSGIMLFRRVYYLYHR